MTVTVLIPVLGRPARARPVAESVEASGCRPYFICTDGDKAQLRAVRQLDVSMLIVEPYREGDYARKINRAARIASSDSEWLFQGADDLEFHDGWLEACMALHERSGALVIGTNDLCNPRTRSRHSTHSLVHRDWLAHAVFDSPGDMLHEGYRHNFVDDELLYRAGLCGVYAHASKAHVEHLHPNCGKVGRDSTYDLALEPRAFAQDRQQLRLRQRQIMRARRPVLRRPPSAAGEAGRDGQDRPPIATV